MNILLVNWNDPENPHAGGAEVHLFEIFSRLVRRGHRVRLVCSGWPGAAPNATIDGIEVLRSGGRHTFTLSGRGAVRRALRAESVDVLVEDINKIPLYTAGLTSAAHCVLVPHLFGATAFQHGVRDCRPHGLGIDQATEAYREVNILPHMRRALGLIGIQQSIVILTTQHPRQLPC